MDETMLKRIIDLILRKTGNSRKNALCMSVGGNSAECIVPLPGGPDTFAKLMSEIKKYRQEQR